MSRLLVERGPGHRFEEAAVMIEISRALSKAFRVIHEQGRCCLHCNSTQANDSLFCAVCEGALWKDHSAVMDFREPAVDVSGKCLFSWFPDQDRRVSKLLLSLKGGRTHLAIDYYVRNFCTKAALVGRLGNTVLIPCPSFKTWDHAAAIAQSFGTILNLPVRNCLIKDRHQEPQKSLNRVGRAGLRMAATEPVVDKHVIFIDDILTTGGTAAAAKRALGQMRSFEVWCLGRRRLSDQSMTKP